MPIVVSDTSVLIDLERGRLLEACFALDDQMAVPDLLYRQELAEYNGEALLGLGLRVEELSSAEVELAQALRNENTKLSFPDAFAFTLAVQRGWELLTGDGALRALCRERQHPFRGVLWVFDRVFEAGILAPAELVIRLGELAAHPRCRLPAREIDRCIARYEGRQAAG